MIARGALLMVVLAGCGHAGPTRPVKQEDRPVIESSELGRHIGEDVTLVGRVSREPWQHLIGDVPGKQAVYFDPRDGGQIVVYVADPITCQGEVQVGGRVLEVRGGSKRPPRPGDTKVDETYAELQLDVSAWRCL